MIQNMTLFQMASGLARHATERQSLTAQNIANADTPGYKARDLTSFSESYEASGALQMQGMRAGHFGNVRGGSRAEVFTVSPFGIESPNGNSVSLEAEMIRSAEVRHQHDMATGIYQKSLQILRTSMGRK